MEHCHLLRSRIVREEAVKPDNLSYYLFSTAIERPRTMRVEMVRAGRPERPVDPAEGPVQSFAHGLRELRRQAGDPSYRTLAERTHYSRTVVSDAARGERLPTLAVALAYVAACDGDADEWRARWHLCHRQIIEAGGTAPIDLLGESNASSEASPPERKPSALQTARLRLLSAPVLVALVIVLLAQAEAAVVWHVASVQSAKSTALTTAVAPGPVLDGADPGTSNCGPSAVVLDGRPIVLPVSATINGHLVPKGTVLGTISLRNSRVCGGAWARFDPVAKIWGHDTTEASILLTVLRPADGTMSQWRLPHIDEAYGDLLLTGMGCVIARGSVKLAGSGVTATAQTSCLPHA